MAMTGERPDMLTARFLLGRARGAMAPGDAEALEQAVVEVREAPARQVLIAAGQVARHATLLVDGFACRYMDDRNGHRQLVSIHVPGDFIDLHGYALKKLDHDIATLGPARLAIVDHGALDAIVRDRPALTRLLWFSTLLDAAMHREWIFRLGLLDAAGRIAHFFCETATRLDMVGLGGASFPLPLTQPDIAEACGLTGVHANRVLRALRERGLMTFRNGLAEIHDRRRLAELADFDPGYLYPGTEALLRAELPDMG